MLQTLSKDSLKHGHFSQLNNNQLITKIHHAPGFRLSPPPDDLLPMPERKHRQCCHTNNSRESIPGSRFYRAWQIPQNVPRRHTGRRFSRHGLARSLPLPTHRATPFSQNRPQTNSQGTFHIFNGAR